MHKVKRFLDSFVPQIIRDQTGKPVEALIDMKSYKTLMRFKAEWDKIQQETGTSWIPVDDNWPESLNKKIPAKKRVVKRVKKATYSAKK